MKSMKLSKKAATALVECSPGDAPAYPYGLNLCLDNESLAKLGITEPPPVGTEIVLRAKAVVTSCGMRQEQDGDKRVHCDMQITDMEFEAPPAEPAKRMYARK